MKNARALRLAALLSLLLLPAATGPLGDLEKIEGTVLLLKFSEGSGPVTFDESGLEHNGTLEGTALPLWTNGMSSFGALDFAGDNSRVSLAPDSASSGVPMNGDWTIQAWCHFPLEDSATRPFKYLVSSQSPFGIPAHIAVSNNKLGAWDSTFYSSGFDVTSLAEGWHLLSAVGVKTGPLAGTTTFYIDANATPVGVSAFQCRALARWIGGIDSFMGDDYSWGAPVDSLRILNVARSVEDIVKDATPATPPDAPTDLAQFTTSGSALPAAAVTHDGFIAKATVTGESDTHHLEVEVKLIAAGFDGTTGITAGADVANGSVASVTVGSLPAGRYHWRVRAVDGVGASTWVSFNAPGGIDFEISNGAPVAGPAKQRLASTGATLDAGTSVFERSLVRFEATGTDPESDGIRLQVEVRLQGTAFLDRPTSQGAQVASGQVSTCELDLSPGTWIWQSRVIDSNGGASAWTRFGAGSGPDLVVISAGSFGPTCGASATGTSAAVLALATVLLARRR